MKHPVVVARVAAQSAHPQDQGQSPSASAHPTYESPGLRTNRLTAKQLRVWERIVAVVMATGRDGAPLHPTLRHLWSSVNDSHHVVHVEMPGPLKSFANRFEVTKVDPGGRSHEAVLELNLRAIDGAAHRPSGREESSAFVPYRGLDRFARYAEGLGHGLAHAVWHLATPERAGLALRLDPQLEKQARAISVVGIRRGHDILEHLESPARQALALEEVAEAAEGAIWLELRTSRRRRRYAALRRQMHSLRTRLKQDN